MKLIKCIVREHKADETADALKAIDVTSITVTCVRGHGRQANPQAVWGGSQYEVRYLPQVMLDIVVDDAVVDDVVRVVMDAARTGKCGDGRVFVMPVETAYTIRTRAGGAD